MAGRKLVYFLPPTGPPGASSDAAEGLAMNLAKGVVGRSDGRYEVELISVAREPGCWPVGPGVSVRRLAASGRPKDPRDAVSWEIPGAFADADLVHLHEAFTRGAEVGLLAAKQQRKPVCVTDHGPATSPLVKQLGLLGLADRVIAHSDFGAGLFPASARVTVVKGGVDSVAFTPPQGPVERDRVLAVGPILPRSGAHRLIEALPPGLPLTVCGRARHEGYFSRLKALAAGKPVEFVTDADDARVLDLYRRAWATVVLSPRDDGDGDPHEPAVLAGLPILESMACGTPTVATRVPAFSEFVRDGVTGFLVDDPAGLTGRLVALATDPVLVERMGRQGRLDVEREFDHRVAGAKLLELYESLIAGDDAGAERAA